MPTPEQNDEYEKGLALLAARSDEFHDHPSRPETCELYEEHYGRRCPCESMPTTCESVGVNNDDIE